MLVEKNLNFEFLALLFATPDYLGPNKENNACVEPNECICYDGSDEKVCSMNNLLVKHTLIEELWNIQILNIPVKEK